MWQVPCILTVAFHLFLQSYQESTWNLPGPFRHRSIQIYPAQSYHLKSSWNFGLADWVMSLSPQPLTKFWNRVLYRVPNLIRRYEISVADWASWNIYPWTVLHVPLHSEVNLRSGRSGMLLCTTRDFSLVCCHPVACNKLSLCRINLGISRGRGLQHCRDKGNEAQGTNWQVYSHPSWFCIQYHALEVTVQDPLSAVACF